MTSRGSREVDERKRLKAAAPKGALLLAHLLREQLEAESQIRFPSPRYREDPVAFAREILGLELWSRQIEILEAVRDNKKTAIASGHKIGKSACIAILAMWFYCSFEDARCVLSSTTSRQVDEILWRELTMMRARGARCLDCKKRDPDMLEIPRPCPHSALIDGDIGLLARTGLKSIDFREIVGFTAKQAEGVAGVSGKNLLYLVDEASGVPDVIFEAMQGNRAGGARIALFSNPTKTSGQFFDAFHEKKKFWKTITVSSEESPNVVEKRTVIPGIAEQDWIDEMREEHGVDHPIYRVRVKGEFPVGEDGKIFSIHSLVESEERWSKTDDDGVLFVGLDPAGATGSGDESLYAIRRGLKQLALVPFQKLDDSKHLVHLLALLTEHRRPRETPYVVIDRDGPIGASLHGKLVGHAEQHEGVFNLVSVRSSDRAIRQPVIYERVRDELTANLEAWMKSGGAILRDTKLHGEMHEMEWEQQVTGRLKVTRKTVLKKKLGRSPDRYDATALSVWEPLSVKTRKPGSRDEEDDEEDDVDGVDPHRGHIDPYGGGGIDPWRGRR